VDLYMLIKILGPRMHLTELFTVWVKIGGFTPHSRRPARSGFLKCRLRQHLLPTRETELIIMIIIIIITATSSTIQTKKFGLTTTKKTDQQKQLNSAKSRPKPKIITIIRTIKDPVPKLHWSHSRWTAQKILRQRMRGPPCWRRP